MEKTLYFTSPNQPHFIEIKNTTSNKQTFDVSFSGSNISIFTLEGSPISSYTNETPYKAVVDGNSTIYLELYPNCSCSTISDYVYCRISNQNGRVVQSYKLVLDLKSDDVVKDINKYRNFTKGFSEYQKYETETFALIQTNPYLTGNVKLKINSNGLVYLSLLDGSYQINNEKFYNRKVGYDSDYSNELNKLYRDLSLNTTDFYKYLTNDTLDSSTNRVLYNQIDDIYFAGAKNLMKVDDNFSMFAPIYINNKIPKYFVIFKRDKVSDLTTQDILKDVTIVKTFDLHNSEIGRFLNRTLKLDNWNKPHLKTSTDRGTILLEMTGIDLKSSSIATTIEDITDVVSTERSIIDFEKHILELYQNRKMVSHKVFNLEFTFNDLESDNYNINSYFGMYVDDLEFGKFQLNSLDDKMFIDCMTFPKTNIVNSNLDLQLNNNFINKGDRLFYLKNNNTFSNILNYENKHLTIDKFVDVCELACKEDRVQIDDICKDYNPFVSFSVGDFSLDGLDFTIANKTKSYRVVIDNDNNIHQDIEDLSSYNTTYSYPVIVNGNIVEFSKIETISDYTKIKLYNEDVLIGEYPIAYSYILGNKTYLVFSDSVDLENVTHIKYTKKINGLYKVPKGIDNNETINGLKNTINENLPFRFDYVDGVIYIVSNINTKFTIQFDLNKTNITPNGIKVFSVQNENISMTVSNSLYIPQYLSITSTDVLKKDEVVVYVDNFKGKEINGDYRFTTSSNDYNILPFFNDTYVLNFLGDSVIKVNSDYLRLEVFKPCDLSYGIFSFYEVKKFDTDKFSSDYNFIKQEFQRYFKNYRPKEKLLPRMIYKFDNLDTVSIRVDVKISVENKFQYETVRTFTLGQNQSATFSTFLSDYGRYSYGDDIEFIYEVSSRRSPNEAFRVYIENVFEDTNFTGFEFEFPLNNYMDSKLDNYIKNQKFDKNPEYPFLKSINSEYDRLIEFSQNRKIEDVLLPKYLKWDSWESLDVKNVPNRLNYSLAFGLTGQNSFTSGFKSNMNIHTNEWFILEEYPNTQKVLEGSQNLYGFAKINDNMFLDKNYNYFEEYFNNGTGNIRTKYDDVVVSNKTLYSKINRIATNTYETFFKGVKWRFFSDKELNDYKFAVLVSTRPECVPNSQSLVEHCPVENVTENCVKVGLLPILQQTIGTLATGNKNLPLKITVINENSLSFIPDVPKSTKITNDIYNSNDFFNDLKLALGEWKKIFDTTFSKSNGWSYDLNVSFDRELELYPYPMTLSPIGGVEKQTNGIGDIRIGFADLGNNDIAKTYYVSSEDLDTSVSYLTPTIILNSRVAFRKNSDTFNDGYSLAYVLAHELGHAFGLGHNIKGNSIMNPTIKKTYNLTTLDLNSTKECVEFIYGKYTDYVIGGEDVVIPTPPSCVSKRNKKNEEFKFLINDYTKSILLKIYVDIPSYLSLDSKKSFIDFYLESSLNRTIRNGSVHSIEGLDVKIPNMNLSLGGVNIYGDDLLVDILNEWEILDSYSVGYSPFNSSYRISGSKNFMIDFSKLEYENNKYKITKQFSDGVYKPYITQMGDNKDTTLDVNFPLLGRNDWEQLSLYKINGGSTLDNGAYKLTLDYLLRNVNDIKFYDETGEVERVFDFSIAPMNNIPIKRPAVLKEEFVLQNVDSPYAIYRHDLNYNPSTQKVIHCKLREDLDLTTYYNLDFYRLNTKLLNNYEGFASYNNVKRIITKDTPDDIITKDFNLFDNKVVYNSRDISYGGCLDEKTYVLFSNKFTSEFVSGFEEPYLFKKYLNSILVNLEDEINYKVPETLVDWNLDKGDLTIKINKDEILLNYLYDKLIDKYSLIYTITDMSKFKISLEKFITNNFINLYTISDIYLITTQSNTTSYKDQDGIIDRVLNKDVDILTIEKQLSFDIDFILKINWKR